MVLWHACNAARSDDYAYTKGANMFRVSSRRNRTGASNIAALRAAGHFHITLEKRRWVYRAPPCVA
eukprot:COSAG01_NODE_5025_length_4539_cov_18.108559_4_plen_66_part_00